MASKPQGKSWNEVQMAITAVSITATLGFWNFFAVPAKTEAAAASTPDPTEPPQPTETAEPEATATTAVAQATSLALKPVKIIYGGIVPTQQVVQVAAAPAPAAAPAKKKKAAGVEVVAEAAGWRNHPATGAYTATRHGFFQAVIYRIDFKAMGCRMIAMLDSPSPEDANRLAQTPNWFEEWEDALSRFRPDSELNRLNRSTGVPVRVSATLWSVFRAAQKAEAQSAGLVSAAVLPALVQAGYDRSFEQVEREQLAPPLPGAWDQLPTLSEVQTNPASRVLTLPLDMQIDFGGVAKGWAAQRAARKLERLGPALVSAGGDIAITGAQRDGNPWPVTIDNPYQDGSVLGTLMLGAGGVATSGTDYRRWSQGGRLRHHIIDPRSGQPAQTDIITATVIAPDVQQAEMAAKTVVILGSGRGMEWIETHPGFHAVLALENGDILYSTQIEKFSWRPE